MSFSALGLSENIIKGVKAMGYVEPTPIQLRAIPLVLTGRDVIGSAQTGTGKTAAFGLPILSKLGQHNAVGPRVLILEPTRELAAQVETAFHDFARFTNLKTTVVFGGVGYGKQNDELKAGTDIVVATPGRLLDHLEQGTLKLDKVEFLVLDEADRMLDMGFLPDVRRIVEKCPRARHTSLFSATVPPQIETLIQWAMHNPETIEIGARRTPAETVKHVIYPVSDTQKSDLLIQLLERVNYNSVLVFCRTKHGADRVAGLLKRNNHAVAGISRRQIRGARRHGHRGARTGHRGRQPRRQLRCAAASGGLHPPHRPHGPRRAQRRRLHHHDRRGRAARLRHRTIHQPDDPAREAGKFQLHLHRALRGKQARREARRLPRQSPRRARPRRLPLRARRTETVKF
jgi:ATP-dependent RNA helicase RhlE